MKTYHIYLRGECLFKDLDDYEFSIIWDRIYKSYFREELTYEMVEYDDKSLKDLLQDSSY